MAQNFIGCDRDQELLLPPSLREWLPEGHLAWCVLESVDELDLGAFYDAYRLDGHGRAAHDPAMMVALLIYGYATGVRTSRTIERHCHDDVAFRVITANQTPDHATIARFRARHETAIAGLFGSVLELCARAGMVEVGVVAVDGSKIAAAATHHATRTYRQIAEEIVKEAGELDAAEDELYGDARGDELPEGFAPRPSGAPGCVKHAWRLTPSAPRRPRRFRAIVMSAWRSAARDWSRTGVLSDAWKLSMRRGEPRGSRVTGGAA